MHYDEQGVFKYHWVHHDNQRRSFTNTCKAYLFAIWEEVLYYRQGFVVDHLNRSIMFHSIIMRKAQFSITRHKKVNIYFVLVSL